MEDRIKLTSGRRGLAALELGRVVGVRILELLESDQESFSGSKADKAGVAREIFLREIASLRLAAFHFVIDVKFTVSGTDMVLREALSIIAVVYQGYAQYAKLDENKPTESTEMKARRMAYKDAYLHPESSLETIERHFAAFCGMEGNREVMKLGSAAWVETTDAVNAILDKHLIV